MARERDSGDSALAAVQVAVRIRPDAVDDITQTVSRFARPAVEATSSTSVVLEPSVLPVGMRDSRYTFNFDQVHAFNVNQTELYHESVEPLVRRFMDGFNTTIFAYGQTSSGKSYTMGTSEATNSICTDTPFVDMDLHVGIIPRAAHQIFQSLEEINAEGEECTVSVSFLELYNEDLIDLLSDAYGQRNNIQIRETRTGDIVWTGLAQRSVSNAQDVVKLLQDGMAIRQTHETEMNAQSSRSHAIFTISLIRKHRAKPGAQAERASSSLGRASPERAFATPRTPKTSLPTLGVRATVSRAGSPTRPQTPTRPVVRGTPLRRAPVEDTVVVTTTSKLHFVDLAGSERLKRTAATGDRAREGIAINSGLHALGNVISVLSDPGRSKRPIHVPYRDSKLTRLLQDSLGGNAHTLRTSR